MAASTAEIYRTFDASPRAKTLSATGVKTLNLSRFVCAAAFGELLDIISFIAILVALFMVRA